MVVEELGHPEALVAAVALALVEVVEAVLPLVVLLLELLVMPNNNKKLILMVCIII